MGDARQSEAIRARQKQLEDMYNPAFYGVPKELLKPPTTQYAKFDSFWQKSRVEARDIVLANGIKYNDPVPWNDTIAHEMDAMAVEYFEMFSLKSLSRRLYDKAVTDAAKLRPNEDAYEEALMQGATQFDRQQKAMEAVKSRIAEYYVARLQEPECGLSESQATNLMKRFVFEILKADAKVTDLHNVVNPRVDGMSPSQMVESISEHAALSDQKAMDVYSPKVG